MAEPSPPAPQGPAQKPGTGQGRSSFWRTVQAVAWSFFGVRRGKDYEQDVRQLDPRHVIVAGVIGGVLFVLLLILLVNWVVSSGVATGSGG
jgi:hypothetical protein